MLRRAKLRLRQGCGEQRRCVMERRRAKSDKNEMIWRIVWPLIVIIFVGFILISHGCGGGGGGGDTKADNSDLNQNNNPPPDNKIDPPPDNKKDDPPPDDKTDPPPDNTNTSPPPIAAKAPIWTAYPQSPAGLDLHNTTSAYLDEESQKLWFVICSYPKTLLLY